MNKLEFIEEVTENSKLFFVDYFNIDNIQYTSDINEEEFEDHKATITLSLSGEERKWIIYLCMDESKISIDLGNDCYLEFTEEYVYTYLFFEEVKLNKQLRENQCKCK